MFLGYPQSMHARERLPTLQGFTRATGPKFEFTPLVKTIEPKTQDKHVVQCIMKFSHAGIFQAIPTFGFNRQNWNFGE